MRSARENLPEVKFYFLGKRPIYFCRVALRAECRARSRHEQGDRDSSLGFAPVDELELEELAVVEMVPSELDGEIQRYAQGRHTVRHLPSDAVQSAALRVFEAETKMHVFEDHRALT